MTDDLKNVLDHYVDTGDKSLVDLLIRAMVEDFYKNAEEAKREAEVASAIKRGLDGFRPLAERYGLNVPELLPIGVPALSNVKMFEKGERVRLSKVGRAVVASRAPKGKLRFPLDAVGTVAHKQTKRRAVSVRWDHLVSVQSWKTEHIELCEKSATARDCPIPK